MDSDALDLANEPPPTPEETGAADLANESPPTPEELEQSGPTETPNERDLRHVNRFTAYRAAHRDVPAQKQLEILSYADAAGLPPEIAEHALDSLKKTVDTETMAEVFRRAPKTAAYLQDIQKTALAKDDLHNLTGLEWWLTGKLENVNPDDSLLMRLGKGVMGMTGQVGGYVAPGWARALSDAATEEAAVAPAQFKRATGTAMAQEEHDLEEAKQKVEGKDYGADSWVARRAVGLAQMVPFIGATTIAGGVGGLLAGPVGAAGAVAAYNFYRNFGPTYDTLKNIKDVDGNSLISDSAARGAAAAASLGVAAIGAGAMGRVIRLVPGAGVALEKLTGDAVGKALAQQSMAGAIKNLIVRQGEGALAGTAFMVGQRVINGTTDRLARASVGKYEDWGGLGAEIYETAKNAAQDMAVFSAATGGLNAMSELGLASRMTQENNAVAMATQHALQSKLFERSETEGQKFVSGVASDARMYWDANDFNNFWQDRKIDPAKLAAEVFGDGGKAYAEVVATGGDLAIPADKYMAKLARSAHGAEIANEVRLSQDGISVSQARRLMEVKAKGAADVQLEDDGAQTVKEDIANKAMAAGQSKEVAEASGAKVGSVFREWAQKLGIRADELYSRVANVRILGPGGKEIAPEPEMAKAAQLRQGGVVVAAPEASQVLAKQFEALGPVDQRKKYFLDPVTGLHNKRAFEQTATPEKPNTLHISVEGQKYINDTAGHEAGNGFLRTIAERLHAFDPEAAKISGDFAVHVKDAAEGERVLDQLRSSLPEDLNGLQVTGKTAPTLDEASKAHGQAKESAEATGARAKRGQKPLGLEKDAKELQLTAKPVGGAPIRPELEKHFANLSPKDRFEHVYVEPDTGLLTKQGWDDLPRKKHVATTDLNWLKLVNEKLGQPVGNDLIMQFGIYARLLGGHEIDFAHLHGDEYAAQSNDPKALADYLATLKDVVKGATIEFVDSKGNKGAFNGISFGHGIGESYEEADAALNRDKAEQSKPGGEREPGTFERHLSSGPGRKLQDHIDQLRRSGGLAARDVQGRERGQAYPGGTQAGTPPEEVNKLEQGVIAESTDGGSFKLEKKGDRGYISFEPSGGGKPRRFDIHLLKNADSSTLAHETFHFLSEVMGDLANAKDAPQEIKDDYQKLLGFMRHESHEARQANSKELRELSKIEKPNAEQKERIKELSAKEERGAYAWEQYLAEGKSPSVELAGVFARFKNWMRAIYRGVDGIQRQFREAFGQEIGLSDEVRGVFNRLLASGEEIQKAEQAQALQPFEPALERMTPEERADYERAATQMRQEAEGELHRRLISATRKENARFLDTNKAVIRGEVEKELDQNPVQRALRFFKTGDVPESPGETPEMFRGPDGQPLKLSREELSMEYSKDFVNGLPKELFAKKKQPSVPADNAALLLGFEDGGQMVRALHGAEPREEAIARETQRRLEELYGPSLLDRPREIASQAVESISNEAAMKKVVLEIRALRMGLDRSADPRIEVLTPETAKATAERLVAGKTVGELLAGDQGLAGAYRRGAATAGRRALQAALDGKIDRAVGEKETQLLNLALQREAQEQRELLERAAERIRGSDSDTARAKLGRADPVYRDAHDAILSSIGIRPSDGPVNIEPAIAKATADGRELGFDVDGLRSLIANPVQLSRLKPDEALNVADAIANLAHIARHENEVALGDRKVAKEEMFAEMAKAVSRRPPQPQRPRDAALEGKLAKARSAVQTVDAALMTPETLVTLLDSGEKDGPFRRALEAPLDAARETKRKIMQETLGKVVAAWKELPKGLQEKKSELLDLTKELPLPDDLKNTPGTPGDGPVTRPYLWMMALNLGNEGNKQRLLDGYGWTEGQVMDVLNTHMTKPEWDFVQKTWDALEGLYPHLAALHERETGLVLSKVKATPIQTPFGEYAGGYFPAREDPRGPKTPVRQGVERVADIFGEQYRRASVASGHRKARVEKADYYVNLNWSVVPSHIAQAIHDIAYREPVKQIGSILLDPRFVNTANGYLGTERAKQFIPWLQAVANESADSVPSAMGGIQSALGYVRGLAMRRQLGGNLASMAQHILDPGIGVATGVTTARDTAMATAKAMSVAMFPKMRAFALENSKELQDRSDHLTRELQEQVKDIGRPAGSAPARALRFTRDKAMDFMGVFHDSMDKFVTTITWTAGYTKGIRDAQSQGLSEAEAHAQAVKDADLAVRKIYPSQDIARQSAAIRSKTFLGTALMFQGFMNKVWNLQRQSLDQAWLAVHDSENGFSAKAGAVAKFGGTMLALAALGAGNKLLRGQGKKDDEDTPEWLSRSLLAEPFSTTPLLGPLADVAAKAAVTKVATGEAKFDRLTLRNAPVADLITGAWDAVSRAANKQDVTADQRLESFIEATISVATAGAGATQIHRTLDYARQLQSGEAQPRGAFDVAGGLIYGKKPKHQGANPFTAVQDIISGQ